MGDDLINLLLEVLVVEESYQPQFKVESGIEDNILDFQGGGKSKEFLDWVSSIDEILEFKEVPHDMQFSLMSTRLHDRAGHDGNNTSYRDPEQENH